jgi:hypothetical protein
MPNPGRSSSSRGSVLARPTAWRCMARALRTLAGPRVAWYAVQAWERQLRCSGGRPGGLPSHFVTCSIIVARGPRPQLPLAVPLRWHPRFRCHPSSPHDGRDACSWRWGGFVGCAWRGCCFAMRSVGCRRGGSRPAAVAADNYKGSSRGHAQAFGAWAWVWTMCHCSSRVRRGQL